jgi:undecaprenyl-diphosphatase
MSVWEALVLGFIQGATEFLPVSSSGHLVMGQALMNVRVPGVVFEVAVHVATLASVLLFYRRRIWELVRGAVQGRKDAWRYLFLLCLATLPAAGVGLGAGDFVEGLFDAPQVAAIGLLVTGTFLWTARWALGRNPGTGPGVSAALLMGLAQAFSIVPGISRSGATVVTGLWIGVAAEEAAAFSFLMAVPAILGAAVLELPELAETSSGLAGGALAVGVVAAALTGILAIWTFVAMLRRKSFHRFGPYCWVTGAAFLIYLTMRG